MGAWNELREPRLGVMLHYDASASDAGGLAWLRDPRCMVSYNWLVLDDGTAHAIAPEDKRAWHAGVCRPSTAQLTYRDANSAFYGVSIAARPGDRATQAQKEAVARLCLGLFGKEGWSVCDTWRVVGHNTEAWARGRKVDPEGPDPARPVLSVDEIRSIMTTLYRR